MTDTKTAKRKRRTSDLWTDEERAAAQEAVKERRARARRGPGDEREAGEAEVQAKFAEMPEPDRAMAERLHALVTASAPSLVPRTWYGMPAYAKDGKVVCFFTPASKFKERYATFGFQPTANLDEGTMWPTSFALTELNAADEERITALVKRAVS